ncbi:uncharacterized protein LOC109838401 [Asparagus officinalis]|uniref:uncharacterized protein LOC109838401 n=1 Tax=Asparagus officinalis TaxID=4686 RepID=UPI00098E7D86|nr:uncharacterized protein LOC109838401 [Asparagus officinalis]
MIEPNCSLNLMARKQVANEDEDAMEQLFILKLKDRKPVEYNSEMFTGAIQNYPTYDKEFYALISRSIIRGVYLLDKEVVVHSDHKSFEFLHAQIKLQQERHIKWMCYLMVFNIIIRYKKGATNMLVDMLSWPPVRDLLVAMRIQPLVPLEYVQIYTSSKDISSVFDQVKAGRRGEYELGEDGLLYRGTSLSIVEDGDRL